MKKLFVFASVLAIVSMAGFTTGCKTPTLEPGGAYAVTNQVADTALFVADGAYQVAYKSLDFAFTFERANEALLWKMNPNIKHTMDKLREQAWSLNVQWSKARQAYVAQPIPSNMSALKTVLAHMQKLAVTAQAAFNNP